MTRNALPLLAFLIAGPALAAGPTGEVKLAKLLAGRTAGKPVDCITQLPTNDSTVIDGIGIVYKVGGTYFLNRFDAGGCPMLNSSFTALVTRTPTDQLCRGDIADVVETAPSVPRGSCAFGSFTPYRKRK